MLTSIIYFFEEKFKQFLMEMKWCMMAGIVLFLPSCGIEEISVRPGADREDVWTGPGVNAGSDGREVCYVTAFDYPDDYDWRTDKEKGSVRCSLVVLADGVPMMKVPVGDEYEVSSDPDMHRMIGGHLYTDYAAASETVIKKDGRTVLRYPGREMICGMLAEGDDIYTLGRPRKGDGFTYRKNGEIVLERESGRTFGRLHKDGDSICFAFAEPVLADGEDIERYYHCTNGRVEQTALRNDVEKVWDIMSYKGEVCWIARVTGVSRPVLYHNGNLRALIQPEDGSPLALRMTGNGDVLFVEGIYTSPEVTLASVFWPYPGHCISFDDGYIAASCCLEGDGMNYVFNPAPGYGQGMIYRSGEELPMPSGYAAMGTDCAAVAGGILNIGLSSQEGERPVMWRDGDVEFLDICGYIASVSVN